MKDSFYMNKTLNVAESEQGVFQSAGVRSFCHFEPLEGGLGDKCITAAPAAQSVLYTSGLKQSS